MEIKPDMGHMSRRKPERWLHGETKKEVLSECGECVG